MEIFLARPFKPTGPLPVCNEDEIASLRTREVIGLGDAIASTY
jgi:hypothetical protein